jgi:DNA-binding transcriptional LysR family regulator
MSIETWDEVRTAYQVARVGTVSGAAEVLGVHHATVIRHIDALETQLGVKLFQRHARGYTATEAGQDLLQVAQATDDQFAQLAGRLRGQGEGMSGPLVVTYLDELSPMVTPALVRFRARHPDLLVRAITGARVFRLEYGEAHLAVRAGAAPQEPDNVVQPLGALQVGLFAATTYLDRRGRPRTDADLAAHDFIGPETPENRAPFYQWLARSIPPERVCFRARESRVLADAVRAGAGLGFVSLASAAQMDGVEAVMPPREAWAPRLWLVTHVDLHRSAKVQALLGFLKEEAKSWP